MSNPTGPTSCGVCGAWPARSTDWGFRCHLCETRAWAAEHPVPLPSDPKMLADLASIGVTGAADKLAATEQPMKPIFETYPNGLYDGASEDQFTHYELQSVRQYQDSRGDRFFEVITDPEQLVSDEWGGAIACSPVLIGLYGRLACGKVVHIVDFNSLEAAHLMLNRMGLMAMDAGRRTTASATTDSTL